LVSNEHDFYRAEKMLHFYTHGFFTEAIFVCIASCVAITAGAKAEDKTGKYSTVPGIFNAS
jgi:hypothetical protein